MHSDNSTASNLPIRFSHLMIIGGIAIVGLYWQSLSFAAEMKHRPVYGCLQLQGSSQHLSGSADRPYIPLMKQEGVRRALFEIHSVWHNGKPEQARIVRRLYFSGYAQPYGEIIDQVRINEIQHSGLEDLLDQIALKRTGSAHLFGRFEGVRHPEGKRMVIYLEFFDDLSREERPALASPYSRKTFPLYQASAVGDVIEVRNLLRTQKFSREQLNAALFEAVRNHYDNTAVIDLLLQAGGDVNARAKSNGSTLLMVAIGIPAEVRTLLKAGANVNYRDQFGKTALSVAVESHDEQSAQLLRQAGAHP